MSSNARSQQEVHFPIITAARSRPTANVKTRSSGPFVQPATIRAHLPSSNFDGLPGLPISVERLLVRGGAMNTGWDVLSAEQRRALLELARGVTRLLHTEVAEQLRNLGLAELTSAGLRISDVGRTLAAARA
jgi:hypothetical protein